MYRGNGKLKVGIFSLSSCEGCLVQVLNLEDELIDIFKAIDLVSCRLLGVEKEYDALDVAIVEGAVTNKEEEKELHEIREKSKLLIALGDCACHGGKFIVKDFHVKEIAMWLPRGVDKFRADPLDKYVNVDYHVYGCPIDREDFITLLKDLLLGRVYRPVSYNVCAECILKENECLLDEKIPCLGPITRGGCKAICPSHGRECIGCRGPAEDTNVDSLIDIFREKGIEIPPYLLSLIKNLGGAKRV